VHMEYITVHWGNTIEHQLPYVPYVALAWHKLSTRELFYTNGLVPITIPSAATATATASTQRGSK